MAIKNEHIIVKNYLKNQSLVESNVASFNDFIEYRMQEIVNETNESIENEDFEITLGKIKVEKPKIIEADGSSFLITPNEARLRDLTYSAPINIELTIKKDGQTDSEVVEIGKIPIMIKSKACNTYGMSYEELISNYNDPQDPGGYFIIKGNERIMIMAEDLAENQFLIERAKTGGLILKMFSLRGTYRIPITISEGKAGLLNLSFSRFKDIPTVVLLKALGLTKESDIAKYIGKENDSVIVNLYEFVNLATKDDAIMYIAEKSNLQGTKKEIVERVKSRIDSYLFPHIGQKKEDRIKKAITLFKLNLGILVRDIKYSLQKSAKRKNYFSIKVLAKSTLFSHRIESAIATGAWTGDRSGITQNMDKTNYLATISQLQRVSSMLPSDQENFKARTLHPTHYGRFCPIETPEGTEIGLRKNLAILSRVSTRTKMNEEEIIKILEQEKLDKEAVEGKDVVLNGKFIGTIKDNNEFVKILREKKKKKEKKKKLILYFFFFFFVWVNKFFFS